MISGFIFSLIAEYRYQFNDEKFVFLFHFRKCEISVNVLWFFFLSGAPQQWTSNWIEIRRNWFNGNAFTVLCVKSDKSKQPNWCWNFFCSCSCCCCYLQGSFVRFPLLFSFILFVFRVFHLKNIHSRFLFVVWFFVQINCRIA